MIGFIRSLFTFRLRPLYVVILIKWPEYFTVQFSFTRWPTKAGIIAALKDRLAEVETWQAVPKEYQVKSLSGLIAAVELADDGEIARCRRGISDCYRSCSSNGFLIAKGDHINDWLATIRFEQEKVWI